MDKDAYIKDLEMRIHSLEEIEKGRADAAEKALRDEKYRLSMLGHDNNRWDFSDNMYLRPSADYKNDVRLQQTGLNQWLWFDQWGLNPDYIKRFPNKIVNSGFEWHDPETMKPLFWDTAGKVTDGSNWEGTYALELAPGQTAKQSTLAEIDRPHVPAGADPAWWENYPTRVSFKHKGGRVKAWVERYDTGEKLYIYDNSQQGNIDSFGQDVGVIREGYELEFGPLKNWAVHWENDEEGVFVDRQEANMKYVTFGYASFWFMPVKGMDRVRVCFQNAEAPEGDYGLVPYWAETAIPEEWKLPSYRPWKIVQGHDVASAEYTQQRISNWIPTNEGRMVCAWIQDVGGTNRIVWCYTSDEQNFLVNNYPGEETVVDETHEFYTAAGGLSLTRIEEDGQWKIMVIVRDLDPSTEKAGLEHIMVTRIKCFVSPSGNGYEMVGEDKVSDLEYRSQVHRNSLAGIVDDTWSISTGYEHYGIVNELYINDEGHYILTVCSVTWRGWVAYKRLFTSRGGWSIFYSNDKGNSWSRVFQADDWTGAYRTGLSKPTKVKGLLIVGCQRGNRQGLLTSSTDGTAWTYRGFMPARAYAAVNRCVGDSLYYDEDEDTLYSATPGGFNGSYIWTLEDPTIERLLAAVAGVSLPGSSAVNYSHWEPLMYIYSNNSTNCYFYKTPQGRLAVQWSTGAAWSETWGTTSGAMTVIIGFTMPTGNVWLDAVQIEPDFTFKHPSFYTQGPRSISPTEIIGMPGIGLPGTDPDTGEPILLPSEHAHTHCADGDDPIDPACIGALTAADIPEVKRFTFDNETIWTVTHNFGERPLVTIWKGSAIATHGFGTQPFGSSPFGGGIFTLDGEEATDEPLIEEVSLNEFTVTWTGNTSGIVVVASSGGVAYTAAWADITGKPTEFTPAEHGNEAHSPNFSAEGHDHDGIYLNKANTDVYTPSADYHPATKKYVDDNAGGGAFTELTDTPADYTGQAGKFVAVVSPGEDGLEFVDAPAGAGNFLALDDTPAAYTGQQGKVATVNAGETAIEFADGPAAANGLPAGGTAGQMLAKIDAADYNAEWVAAPSGGGVALSTVKKLVALGM